MRTRHLYETFALRGKMKKILLITHELTYTGAPKSNTYIAKAFIELGFHVDVWSFKDGENKQGLFDLGITPDIIPLSDFFLLEDVYREKIARYCCVICNTIVTYIPVALFCNSVPIIWYIREAGNLPSFTENVVCKEIVLEKYRFVYSVSEYARDTIECLYNNRSLVIHNFTEDVDIAGGLTAHISSENVTLAIIGTVCRRKGADLVVEAIDLLDNEISSRFTLKIIGNEDSDIEYHNYLRRVCEKAHCKIQFIPNISDKHSLYHTIKNVDVVIVPSRDESCSLVALEAAMLAKPLLVSSNVGAKYIVTSDSGWIFENENVDELSVILEEIYKNKDKLRQMGCASRRNFEKEVSYEKYMQQLENAVNNTISSFSIDHLWADELYKEFWQCTEEYLDQICPEEIKAGNKQIVLYGSSEQAKITFYFLRKCYNVQVIAWVDKKYESVNNQFMKVVSPSAIVDYKYDYIVIAVWRERTYRSIIDDLEKNQNIDMNKVLWCQNGW